MSTYENTLTSWALTGQRLDDKQTKSFEMKIRDDLQLIGAQIYFRHGARTPLILLPGLEEVDEQEFFYGQESGGTIVLSALEKTLQIVRDRYPTNEWNVYIGQASDGDCFGSDGFSCIELLENSLLPITSYMAYINIGSEEEEDSDDELPQLQRVYKTIAPSHENFSVVSVKDKKSIYPVFRKLFSKSKKV